MVDFVDDGKQEVNMTKEKSPPETPPKRKGCINCVFWTGEVCANSDLIMDYRYFYMKGCDLWESEKPLNT
jgi:hypothetical protein